MVCPPLVTKRKSVIRLLVMELSRLQVIGVFVTVVDPPPIRNRRLVRLIRKSGMGKIVGNSLALVLLVAILAVLLVGEASPTARLEVRWVVAFQADLALPPTSNSFLLLCVAACRCPARGGRCSVLSGCRSCVGRLDRRVVWILSGRACAAACLSRGLSLWLP